MSPKLPQVSGEKLTKSLEKLGYKIMRQRGSHIRLRKTTEIGEYNITVPNHRTIARGTLSDIITKISLWNNISKEEILKPPVQ